MWEIIDKKILDIFLPTENFQGFYKVHSLQF